MRRGGALSLMISKVLPALISGTEGKLNDQLSGKRTGRRPLCVDCIDFHGVITPTMMDFKDGYIEQLIHKIRKT